MNYQFDVCQYQA